jgi:hypothetical protein
MAHRLQHGKANIIARSEATDVCVPAVPCVGLRLAMGSSPVQGVLPNIYRIAARARQRALESFMKEQW